MHRTVETGFVGRRYDDFLSRPGLGVVGIAKQAGRVAGLYAGLAAARQPSAP